VSTPFTVACIQLNSGRELGPNIETTQRLVREARRAGAEFILTPENTTCIEPKRDLILAKAQPEASHPGHPRLQRAGGGDRRLAPDRLPHHQARRQDLRQSQLPLRSQGGIAARYDKIHMFDVDLANGERYRESATFRPDIRR
jgi:Predicted amidohydrolase